MTTTVSAIYEDGVLRLLAPLPLPDHTPVKVTVDLPQTAAAVHSRERLQSVLVVAGLSLPQPEPWAGPAPLSPKEREMLAEEVVVGRPLSEIIGEEREEHS